MRRNPKLTLVYFPMAGRAEASRLAAVAGGVAFTNKVVDRDEFVKLKPDLPLGQLPILEIEEEGKEKVIIPQSDAILRYFGKIGGLYPDCPVEALQVDALLASLEDFLVPLLVSFKGLKASLLSDTDSTSEDHIKIRGRIVETYVPKYVGMIEETLKANITNGCLVGEKLTVADIKVVEFTDLFTSGMLDGIPTTVLDQYPLVLSLAAKIKDMPSIAAWYEKTQLPYTTFDYNPSQF